MPHKSEEISTNIWWSQNQQQYSKTSKIQNMLRVEMM